jgi:RHS repeat-associated protein
VSSVCFVWAYDNANNVTSFTTNGGTASYGYDTTNQVTSASYTGTNQPANESYSYDKNGNRTNTGYSTGSANLITSDSTFNYQHDADGNETVRTRISNNYAADYKTTYTWDYRNRLTDVQYYDNNSVLTKHVHFVYDVYDSLIATEVDSTGSGTYNKQDWYAADAMPVSPAAGRPFGQAAQPLLDFNASGVLTQRYLTGPNPAGVDAVLAQEAVSSLSQGGVVSWMIDDNLGSVRVVLDSNSNVLDKINYSSFGSVAYESAPSTNHWTGFAGGHFDPSTGLVNESERWLDPATGRWLSQDPIGFSAGDSNLSRYVSNSPTNATDPTGLSADYQIASIVTGGTYYTTSSLLKFSLGGATLRRRAIC